ncbi:MAG: DNA-methyltransferase [Thermodesulfobacteriota bacterium]
MNDTIGQVIKGKRRFAFVSGECFESLKRIPDHTINCVITSPPYWQLREYDTGLNGHHVIGSERNPNDYVENLVRIFNEVKRVLTKDGSLWLNLGDKYHNKQLMGMPWRVALSMMENGWILRNDIIWDQMKGTQSAKDRLRDVYEHVFHFVQSKKYYYAHDEIRISPKKRPRKSNGKMVSATGVSGKKYRDQIGESDFLSMEEKKHALEALENTLKEMTEGIIVDFRMTIRGVQRTFHSDKTKVSGRAKELENKGFYILKMRANGHLPSDIWRIVPEDQWRKDSHYAVFPEELLTSPIKATCPENGIVLDPFSGTGSAVYSAVKLRRKGIGIELSEKYNSFAEKRLANLKVIHQLSLS